MNVAKAGILLVIVGVLVWLMAGSVDKPTDRKPRLGARRTTTASAEPAGRSRVPMARGRFYMGMGIQLYDAHLNKKRYMQALGEMAEMGASAVLMTATGSQEHAGSNKIFRQRNGVPSREDLGDLVDRAHRLGMAVILMPIVLFTNPKNDEWRGEIKPESWDAWFASYLDFIKYFADVGRRHGVEVLMVGSELISTEVFTQRWRHLIAEIRKVFPGQLAYSSNWDHYDVIKFWDDLDLIGMTTYHTLSDKPNPELATLVESWKPIKKKILAWQKSIDRPILFTEVGWCSQDGASTAPWNYYHQDVPKATRTGLIEQERCYQAFIETWRDDPHLAGTIWWEYNPWSRKRDDIGYDPRGKPAEEPLRAWFAHYRTKTEAATRPATRLAN